MISIECTYSNGNTITTRFNGTLEDARQYFLGQWFNLGIREDDMQECMKVERMN